MQQATSVSSLFSGISRYFSKAWKPIIIHQVQRQAERNQASGGTFQNLCKSAQVSAGHVSLKFCKGPVIKR